MTVENVYEELRSILPGGEKRAQMLEEYARMRNLLGSSGASHRAAEIMIRLLQGDKLKS